MTSTRAREILILDDEPIVGDRLKPPLEKCGYLVETLSDSQQAVERLAHKRYDLLITDLVLPGPCGREVAEELRKQRPRMRVLYISGYADAERTGSIEARFFCRKPFSDATLGEKVRELLGMEAATAG